MWQLDPHPGVCVCKREVCAPDFRHAKRSLQRKSRRSWAEVPCCLFACLSACQSSGSSPDSNTRVTNTNIKTWRQEWSSSFLSPLLLVEQDFNLLTAHSGPRPPPAEFPHSWTLCLVCRNALTSSITIGVTGWLDQSRMYMHSGGRVTHMSLCNKTTHTRGGDGILALLFKHQFSLTTVLEDHNEQSGCWSLTKGCQHLRPSFWSVAKTTRHLQEGGVVYFWLKHVDVKSSRLILRVQDKEVYGNLGSAVILRAKHCTNGSFRTSSSNYVCV